MMESIATCAACGQPLPPGAPPGFCPKCAFGGALDAGSLVGRTVGDYEILEEIGRGGMGTVYKARQTKLNRIVAFKVPGSGSLASAEEVRRFKAEAETVARFNHPAIVAIHEVGEHDGHPYFSMACVEGCDLAERLKSKRFSPRDAAQLIVTLARAVHYAHQRGVLHRDLKPSNVLLDVQGNPHLTDFGLARLFEGDAVARRSRVIAGSPAYMAPEQLREDSLLTVAVDVHGLGAVLYELLTGRPPFVADSHLETLRQVAEKEPTSPRHFVSKLDRDLETVCLKCLEKDPSRRYTSAEALAEELERWLKGEPIVARPASVAYRCNKFVRRHKVACAAATAVLMALAAGAVISTWFFVGEMAARQRETAARQISELREADLATRSGRWPDALNHWDAAERAGYNDNVDLGLKRAEAWIILHDRVKAGAEFQKLLSATESSALSSAVLLRAGEFEMFDHATFDRGVRRIREAVTNGLSVADEWLARGLLAESTPDALDAFRRALELDPYLHSAHRHSLGLEFALGRHDELASHLRVASALYPGDFSHGILQTLEHALMGREREAQAGLETARKSMAPESFALVAKAVSFFGKVVKHFEVENYLGENKTNGVSKAELITEATQVLLLRNRGDASPSSGALPSLPCAEQGIRLGFDALQSLAVAGLLGGTDAAVEKVRESWRHHPEALFPTFAGMLLENQQPRSGPRNQRLLALQSEMYQKAVDSPSVLPNLGRLARVMVVDAQVELSLSKTTNVAGFRTNCLANLRRAAEDPGLTTIECGAYSRWSFKLGAYDLNRQFIARWETLQTDDASLLRNRIRLELAVGAYGSALKLIDRALAANPGDKQAIFQRETALREIKNFGSKATEHPTP